MSSLIISVFIMFLGKSFIFISNFVNLYFIAKRSISKFRYLLECNSNDFSNKFINSNFYLLELFIICTEVSDLNCVPFLKLTWHLKFCFWSNFWAISIQK